ncbi:hypothetical protein L2E82_26030 [Cichorium intybus]|uniref:Uncharacterized protein n=1 Tax=Cichorium intybus TaxID=13427 RepID=A0ACB9E4W8_CICIN|nr:hypothetical protein L2E82_26030 [Cichorium intybus]
MAVATSVNGGGTMTAFLVCILMFTGFSVCKAQAAAPAVYMFGDSLVDVGNNNYLPLSIAKADFPHNGVDFPAGKPTGRFSNGMNAADFLAKKMGLPTSPPYLSLIGSAKPPITGVSFASGGCGILNSTGDQFIQCISLSQQVEYFSLVNDQLVKQLGPSGAQVHLSKSLFAIVIGSNDFFTYFTTGSTVSIKYTPQQYVDLMVSTFKRLLKMLYNIGARKVMVSGVGAIGCCPVQRKENKTSGCNVGLNYWSSKYNDGLKAMLQDTKSELGMNYAYFDIYGAMVNLFQEPQTYGFTEIKVACCGLGNLNADVPCIPLSSYCSNRRSHVFWDLYHPTETVYSLFSDILYSGSQQYMFPMNVEQLLAV